MYKYLYNNTPSNAIVNAVSNISHRLMLQVDAFAVLFMNEFKNLTNVVIGKNINSFTNKTIIRTFLNFRNYKIIIVQVRYITI